MVSSPSPPPLPTPPNPPTPPVMTQPPQKGPGPGGFNPLAGFAGTLLGDRNQSGGAKPTLLGQ